MTDNLFQEQNQPTKADPNKDYWVEYTQPGGKFYDPDPEVVKKKISFAKAESDNYIKHLEQRLDEMRVDTEKAINEANAGKSLSEYIEELKTLRQPQQQHQQDTTQEPKVNTPAIKPEDLDSLFDAKLQERETLKQRRANMQEVQAKLTEKYGENYSAQLRQQAQSLGISETKAQELAQDSPAAFFRMFGIDAQPAQEGFMAPPRTTQRKDPFAPKSELRDWAFYEKMRRDQPKLYHNPKTHVQMHKDATEIDAQYGEGTFMGKRR